MSVALLLLLSAWLPAQPVVAQQPASAQAESPYLDIQWNSPLVLGLLRVNTGVCQADANADAAPVKSKYDSGTEWLTTMKPSVLRAMFYLAYDYYGLGLNHYFTLRQDLLADFDKRFAAAKPLQYQKDAETVKLVTRDYTAFKLAGDTKAVAGEIEVAAKPGEGATQVYYRHATIDPFDLEILADQIHLYRVVGLAPVGQKVMPMDVEVAPESIHKYYEMGTLDDEDTGAKRLVGLRRVEAFWYPGTAADGTPDYSHYTATGVYRYLEPVRAPYRVDGQAYFGAGMLRVDPSAAQHTLCAQWRMQQERERAGQATDSDRLLTALLQRAGVKDELGSLWVIPAEGY